MHQARHRPGGSTWSIRPRSLTALAVAAVGLTASIWLAGRDDVASAAVAHPAFSDDFSGAPGSPADQDKWSLDGGPGAGGAQDGNGNLVLTRLLRTRQAFDQRYGHAEARIEANRPPGVWRAFSVLDRYGRLVPGRLESLQGGIDPTNGDAFHTYAIDWSPQAIVWSVDGHPTLRLTPKAPADGIVLVLDLTLGRFNPVRMTVDDVHVSVYSRPGYHPTPSQPEQPSPSTTSASDDPSAPAPGASSADPAPGASSADPPASPSSASPSPAGPPASPSTSPTPDPTPTKTVKVSTWKAYTDYQAGDLVKYKGVTYQVLETHTSLPGWEPPNLPSLFKKV